MTSPYRENLIVKKENEEKDCFEYHICEKDYVNNGNCTGYYCPVCNTLNTSDFSFCAPNKRIVIRGHLFWKKYCTINNSIHYHFTCFRCKSNIIAILKTTCKKPYKVYLP